MLDHYAESYASLCGVRLWYFLLGSAVLCCTVTIFINLPCLDIVEL
jgi:hypothetical protein